MTALPKPHFRIYNRRYVQTMWICRPKHQQKLKENACNYSDTTNILKPVCTEVLFVLISKKTQIKTYSPFKSVYCLQQYYQTHVDPRDKLLVCLIYHVVNVSSLYKIRDDNKIRAKFYWPVYEHVSLLPFENIARDITMLAILKHGFPSWFSCVSLYQMFCETMKENTNLSWSHSTDRKV